MDRRILLISANERQSARLQVALLHYGLMVEVAGTPRRGLSVAQHRPPAAIVLDEAIPEPDRSEIRHTLKADSLTARIPLVMLGRGDGETFLEALAGGASASRGMECAPCLKQRNGRRS